MSDIETAEELVRHHNFAIYTATFERSVDVITARDAAVAREAKLQALCDMHATAMRLRKYGREPEWLGAAFTELRAKYEKGPDGE